MTTGVKRKMNWKDKFLKKHLGKSCADLKRETEIKKADMNISRVLKEQRDKERSLKAKKDVQRMLKGGY